MIRSVDKALQIREAIKNTSGYLGDFVNLPYDHLLQNAGFDIDNFPLPGDYDNEEWQCDTSILPDKKTIQSMYLIKEGISLHDNDYLCGWQNSGITFNPGFKKVKTLGDFNHERFMQLFERTEKSPFGNVETGENEVNQTIRSSHELQADRDFVLKPDILKSIRKKWKKRFYPQDCIVKPYKMLFYRTGDEFKPHKDTPEPNLIGFAVLCIHSDQDWRCEDSFQVEESIYTVKPGQIVLFYPDCVHSVPPIISNSRITITFKIFSTDKSMLKERPVGENDMNFILNHLGDHFGVILDRNYYCGSETAVANDYLLMKSLIESKRYELMMIPVLIEFHAKDDYDGNVKECRARVKAISKETFASVGDVEGMVDLKSLKEIDSFYNGNYNFYSLDAFNSPFDEKEDPGAECTCNEARPADLTALYCQTAMLVKRKVMKRDREGKEVEGVPCKTIKIQ